MGLYDPGRDDPNSYWQRCERKRKATGRQRSLQCHEYRPAIRLAEVIVDRPPSLTIVPVSERRYRRNHVDGSLLGCITVLLVHFSHPEYFTSDTCKTAPYFSLAYSAFAAMRVGIREARQDREWRSVR